ncbi:hypothetical protein BABINDRAFT_71173 [Babjeviella inositovora NRRL Y-12698]|uniref:Uncharacterized protein n=1 Tax=Babjeviella inositovora NRRL Y-12698 TaxID=984486 RepID=A0A1E3QXH7_9ASCO|nr:uncharacterized protein BABINDRAFT_71173 [Babjeviella inositovora NRRL Y-12698]ODQ82375.1 hypothetical protein BABINDRAFT_71173 [Babjeviella inositovora NRRL Y-12698]
MCMVHAAYALLPMLPLAKREPRLQMCCRHPKRLNKYLQLLPKADILRKVAAFRLEFRELLSL